MRRSRGPYIDARIRFHKHNMGELFTRREVAAFLDWFVGEDCAAGSLEMCEVYTPNRRRMIEPQLTLKRIGDLMGGISRERVRQIEAEALAKLREGLDIGAEEIRHL